MVREVRSNDARHESLLQDQRVRVAEIRDQLRKNADKSASANNLFCLAILCWLGVWFFFVNLSLIALNGIIFECFQYTSGCPSSVPDCTTCTMPVLWATCGNGLSNFHGNIIVNSLLAALCLSPTVMSTCCPPEPEPVTPMVDSPLANPTTIPAESRSVSLKVQKYDITAPGGSYMLEDGTHSPAVGLPAAAICRWPNPCCYWLPSLLIPVPSSSLAPIRQLS